MPWVRVDDSAPTHAKVIQCGLAAFGLFVAGLCYANRYLTDGFIPTRQLNSVFPGVAASRVVGLAVKLVEAGLWEVKEDGYQIHDYHDYQATAAVIRSMRETRAEAGRRGGKQSASKRASKPEANAEQNPTPLPLPHQLPKEQTKSSKGNGVLSDADFLAALKANPAYEGIDIDRELGKLDAWLLTPKGRGKTRSRQRIVNWLNGADRAVAAAPVADRHVNNAWAGKSAPGDVKL